MLNTDARCDYLAGRINIGTPVEQLEHDVNVALLARHMPSMQSILEITRQNS